MTNVKKVRNIGRSNISFFKYNGLPWSFNNGDMKIAEAEPGEIPVENSASIHLEQ